MRKNLAIFFLSLAFLVPAQSQGQAVRDYSNRANSVLGAVYLGLKYGRYQLFDDDLDDGDEADSRNVGVVFGKSINDVLGWEFEYTYTATEEDDWLGAELDVSAETIGFYLVAKTDGDIYVKGRLGYTRVEQDIDLFDEYNVYGIAYGIGAGAKIGKTGAIEVEYTVFPTEERDISSSIPATQFSPAFAAGTDFDIESNLLTVAYIWSFE